MARDCTAARPGGWSRPLGLRAQQFRRLVAQPRRCQRLLGVLLQLAGSLLQMLLLPTYHKLVELLLLVEVVRTDALKGIGISAVVATGGCKTRWLEAMACLQTSVGGVAMLKLCIEFHLIALAESSSDSLTHQNANVPSSPVVCVH